MSVQCVNKDLLEYFEAAEGTYRLKSVLNPKGLISAGTLDRLPSVRISFCDSHHAWCLNTGRDIFIYPISGCQLYDAYTSPGKRSFKTSSPVCHDFNISSLLLIGLSSGEVNLIDPFHKDVCKTFNEEKQIEKSSVTSIRWVPYSANHFLVAHASGHLYLYSDDMPCCNLPPTYQIFKKSSSFTIYTCKTKSTCNPLYNWALADFKLTSDSESTKSSSTNQLQSKISDDFDLSSALLSPINQFSFSNCGNYLAVVTEDGYLRVFDYNRMELYGFMRSYFGGLTCVDWSPDGKFVVVGGQDDLITIWSFTSKAVICRGQGHKSWTNVVRFDPFVLPNNASPENGPISAERDSFHSQSLNSLHPPSLKEKKNAYITNDTSANAKFSMSQTYRLGSVGQDTFMCLWELTEDVIRQGLRFSGQTKTQDRSNTNNNSPDSKRNNHQAEIPEESSHDEKSSINKRSLIYTPSTVPRSRRKQKNFSLNHRQISKIASNYLPNENICTSTPIEFYKSSVLSDSGLSSIKIGSEDEMKHDVFPINSACIFSSSRRDLLGTPNCPRLSDVPILEPFAKFGITRDLVTDMVFREDSINLAFQQGVILTFGRPVINSQLSDSSSYAQADGDVNYEHKDCVKCQDSILSTADTSQIDTGIPRVSTSHFNAPTIKSSSGPSSTSVSITNQRFHTQSSPLSPSVQSSPLSTRLGDSVPYGIHRYNSPSSRYSPNNEMCYGETQKPFAL